LFLDRYQLSDDLFLASLNLVSLRSLSGEQDLEAPDWAVSRWGSAALLELAKPTPAVIDLHQAWTVELPMHLRYLTGQNKAEGVRTVKSPWPVLFWACEAEEGLKMSVNPFDRVNLGYDGLFGPRTMFYHIPPTSGTGSPLFSTVEVPVLDVNQASYLGVEFVTGLVVMLGFAWVCWKLLAANLGRNRRAEEAAEVKKAN